MLHALEHAFEESIELVPILLITYIFMEWLEHKAKERTLGMVRVSGKLGPVLGGLFGIIPQCGFSGAAASFYAAHSITLGTLIAIFMATSDEMLPILISAPEIEPAMIARILALKCVFGVACGYLVDLCYHRHPKIEANHIHDFCEQEHCDCEQGILKSAIKHTIQIVLLIFIVSALLNLFFEYAEDSAYAALFWQHPVWGYVLSGLIGLIPNCSASVLITNLYVQGLMSASVMMAGLFVNAGVGLLVLYKVNHHWRENVAITCVLYALGIVSGVLCGWLI